MRTALMLTAFWLTSLSACAQPAPGYGDQPPPPGYGQAPPPSYGQTPPPGYGQQGWAGGMQGAGGQTQAPPPGGYGAGPQGGPPPMAEEGGGGRGKMAEKFAEANVTHDGRLTQQQAQAAGMKGIARHFAQIDRDQKGYVTIQDIKAWRQERHAAKAGQQSGPAGGTPGYPPPAPAGGYPPSGPAGQQY